MSFTCVMSKSMHYKRSERKSRTSNLPNYKSSNTCKQHLAKGQRSRYGTFIKIDPRNALFVFEVLYLIKMGSKSGYQVQKAFKDLLGLKVSFGLLYPTLHILLKQGYLTCDTSYSSERFPRKVYSITEKGLEAIENNIKFMKYFVT